MTKDKDIKTVVPLLRFPEFRDAEGWRIVELNKACTINPATKELPDSFVYIDLESVQDGKLLQKKIIEKHSAPSRAQRLLNKGDIIYQTVRPYQKNNYFFNLEDGLDYVASTGYAQLRAFQSNSYIYQYIHTEEFVSRVIEKCTGSNYPAINSSDLSNMILPVPNIREQEKIANCLDSLDDLICAVADKIEALKEHKKGLMQQLFPAEGRTTPALRFPEFQNAPEWQKATLEKVCDMQAGKFVSASNIFKKKADDMYPCYGGNGLRGYTYSFTHSGIYSLIGRQGALCGNVTHVGGKFHATEHAVVTTCKKNIDSQWLFYLLIQLNLNQYATGQAQPGLSVEVLKKVAVCLPIDDDKKHNIKEQQQIAACLSSVDVLISAETDKLDQLKAHKKGLMQQLFPTINE